MLVDGRTLFTSTVHTAGEQLEWRHSLHVLARDVRQVLLCKRSTLVILRGHHVDVDDLTSSVQMQALDVFREHNQSNNTSQTFGKNTMYMYP